MAGYKIFLLAIFFSAVNSYKTVNLDEVCTDDVDCVPRNSICSKNRTCQCQEPYYAEQGLCHAKIDSYCEPGDCTIVGAECVGSYCSCSGNSYPTLDKLACIFFTHEIGGSCRKDDDCRIENSHCSKNNTCECSDSFVEQAEKCVPKAQFGEYCSGPEQCACQNNNGCYLGGLYEDLLCSNNTCSCPNKYHIVHDKFSCFPLATVVNDKCANNASCKNLENSICSKDICVCRPYHFQQDNKCFKGIDADCLNKPDECKVENSICLNNKCKCQTGWHLSINKRSCIKTPTTPGDICEKKSDCNSVPNSYCSKNNTCECLNNFVEQEEQCVPKAQFGEYCSGPEQCACQNNNGCYLGGLYEDLLCSNNTCSCPNKYHIVHDKFSCFPLATVVNDKCVNNISCGPLENSLCSNGTCVCAPYYFEKNKQCVKGIGAPCSNNVNDCRVTHSICSNNKCQCPTDWHLSMDKLSCIITPTTPGDFCEQESDCSSVPNTNCFKHKCECLEQHILLSNKCVKKADYGDPCEDNKQCACENKNCSLNKPYVEQQCHGTCKCPAEYHYVPAKLLCIPTAKGLGAACQNNDSCSLIGNAVCSNKTCACQKNHFEQNKKCVKGIGADCSKTYECQAQNSVCLSKKCSCESHMHVVNNSCVKNVLGDACKEDKDCKETLFAVCSNKKCACDKTYTKKNNQCFATEETKCSSNNDCKRPEDFFVLEQDLGTKFDDLDLENFYHDLVCSKQNCSCSEGFHYVKNKLSCVKSTKRLGELCLMNEHCQLFENADCINNKCDCKEHYFEQKGLCLRGVGADCSGDHKCDADHSMCSKSSKKCICKPRNIYHSVEQCKPVRSFSEQCDVDDQCSCLHGTNCHVTTPYQDLICSKHCDCSEGSHFVQNKTSCIVTTKVVDGACDNDDNCLLLKNTKCQENRCSCLEHYFVSEKQCKQGLNSNCTTDEDCSAVPNARCQEQTCKCMEHNVEESTGLCVEVLAFGEQCKYDVQCQAITANSSCRQNTEGATDGPKTCQCDEGEHVRNNGCYKTRKLDENCDNLFECHLEEHEERAECRNNTCVCSDDFKKVNSTYCGGAGSVAASILLTASVFLLKLIR